MSTATKMKNIPTIQKSWRVTGKGKPADVLKLDDTPVPTKLGKGEILVKVQAAALNPVGHKALSMLPSFVLRRVKAFEFDFAGVVVDGNGTEFKEGDEVFAVNLLAQVLSSGRGALAQYTIARASQTALRPQTATPSQASGFGIAAMTAYQALTELAQLEPGQSVFVNGGSTAVGAYAIQVAKAMGARVAASASAKNEEYVRSLGADEFFDYTTAPLHAQLAASAPNPKYHVFYETVGLLDPALFVASPAYLAPGGVFISVGPQGSGLGNIVQFAWKVLLQPAFLGGVRRRWKLIAVWPDKQKHMDPFARLVEEGKVKPLVDSVYAYEDVQKAYERIMTGRATGKVVVKVDPDAE